MTQSDFVKYWRAKDFAGKTPKFNKKIFSLMINELTKVDDFRKLTFEEKKAIADRIFGNPKNHYNKFLGKEIDSAISIGKKRLGI
jgi:hypothetical protein